MSDKERGFSLLEVLIVLGLVAVIAGFGMTFSMSTITRSHAQSERDFFVSLLTAARAKSLANVDEAPHGVAIDISNKTYVTYKGTSLATGGEKRSIPLLTSAAFAGTHDISFGQLSARVATSQVGTTTISLGGQSYEVNVNSVGRIEW